MKNDSREWPVVTSTGRWTGETVDIEALDVADMAEATSRCLSGTDDFWGVEYIERMIDKKTGKKYDIVYLFDEDDMMHMDNSPRDPEDYPWDEEHIARVFAVEDDM